ncbi:MAG TPA: class I SAM-dependent methyltransferase [Candidatus Omnitrophota bacterium]|jgi:SAM-dependent methyltransferase|nr:class I SAM-dependent methyltransferase [Candidatus Omnitrophota bacterium]
MRTLSNFFKKMLVAVFCRKPFARFIVRRSLQLHNLAYRYAGRFSCCLEPGGLHPKHRLINYHKWFVDHVKKEWIVLDVGCGNGALTYDLACSCHQVVAVDKNPVNIQEARARYVLGNIEYILGEAPGCLGERVFDAVVLSNVLEHIVDRQAFLQALLRRTTRLLIRVPVIDRDWITLYKKEAGFEWRLDPTHEIEYTEAILAAELKAVGLDILSCERKFGELYCLAAACQESGKDKMDEALTFAAHSGHCSLF